MFLDRLFELEVHATAMDRNCELLSRKATRSTPSPIGHAMSVAAFSSTIVDVSTMKFVVWPRGLAVAHAKSTLMTFTG